MVAPQRSRTARVGLFCTVGSFLACAANPAAAQSSAACWDVGAAPGRTQHAVAYDSVRQRLVVFGGQVSGFPNSGRDPATWEWDGSRWFRVTATGPAGRTAPAMAFDSARQRTLLFGGSSGTALSDTWEWNGSLWTQRTPATVPPARSNHAVTFDSGRQRVVMFGGSGASADTWEWDGTNWSMQSPTPSPAARWGHAMVYDSVRARVVLFGGISGVAASNQTWEWDGAVWTLRAPATSPSARYLHGMTYDPVRQRTILYGGQQSGVTFLNDTWEWDGNTWSPVVSSTVPGAKVNTDMAYFAAAPIAGAVLFGGTDDYGTTILGDTLSWNGSQWTLVAAVPPPRASASMAFDVSRGRAVMFGGAIPASSAGNYSRDTWEWNGAGWALRSTSGPAGRQYAGLVYDSARGRTLLFGGYSSASPFYYADTWEWDGSAWMQRSPTTSPAGRERFGMAFDASRSRAVVFGGWVSGGTRSRETWEWDGTTWALRSSSGPTARIAPAMAYSPASGTTILYGGSDATGTLSDTWEWDGVTWKLLTPAANPGPRAAGVMAFDLNLGRLVLYGSYSYPAGTWEWDGANWGPRSFTLEPQPRYGPAMTYDTVRGRMLLFGGATASDFYSSDTWLMSDLAIVQGPAPLIVPSGQNAAFTVAVRGSVTLAYSWRHNATVLTDSSHISGATGPTLTIIAVTLADEGSYDCIVTNACGSLTSDAATLDVSTSACGLADIVAIGGEPPPDGLLTGDDFNAYINAFAAGDALADIVAIGGLPPPDGLITGDDFNAFINGFAQGCP